MRSIRLVLGLPMAAFLFAPACATTKGAQPHDMSAAQHEAMASSEEHAGAAHERSFDPSKATTKETCQNPGRQADQGDTCWSSETNPTAAHLEAAATHRKMAADHRAASQSLRDAEASACAGLSADNRDMSPFEHPEDIASVEPSRTHAGSSKSGTTHVDGAVITFRAVPGMTAQWLQRVIDCHLARNAALGHQVPEMPSCPLVPKDITASVAATDKGFAVTVRSENGDAAQEVLRRAQSLVRR